MRITGGQWCGHPIRVPKLDVRPTQDRVREALFSMIGEGIVDAVVWDLFAGSGAFGFDALSRGAKSVTWVERSASAVAVIKENIGRFCGDEAAGSNRCIGDSVDRFLARVGSSEPAEIVFFRSALRECGKRWRD